MSSDDDDENGLLDTAGELEQRIPDTTGPSDASQAANGANGAASMRGQSRHAERGPSDNSSEYVLSSREPEFVVNPDELVESDESDESDEEAVVGHNEPLPVIDNGHS